MYAHTAPGGYEMIFGIIVVFALTAPGAVLSTAFLPGYKITLVGISLALMASCASPGIWMISKFANDQTFLFECTQNLMKEFGCFDAELSLPITDLNNAKEEFIGCIAGQLSIDPITAMMYCTPPEFSILPQMGLFQTLALMLQSEIKFYSKPADYAEIFVERLASAGASCAGDSCKFQYARKLYRKHLGFMMLGAVLLLFLGIIIAKLIMFPFPMIVRMRQSFGAAFECRGKRNGRKSDGGDAEIEELGEVDAERRRVKEIVRPILKGPADIEANDDKEPQLSYVNRNKHQNELPPVIMHKLRKVFPALGGAPPKVKLPNSFLHP